MDHLKAAIGLATPVLTLTSACSSAQGPKWLNQATEPRKTLLVLDSLNCTGKTLFKKKELEIEIHHVAIIVSWSIN